MDQREIIYGVCDKTGSCDSYFGFFKHKEDAEKEVWIQSVRIKNELGIKNIDIQKDRSLVNGKLIVVIHSYILR